MIKASASDHLDPKDITAALQRAALSAQRIAKYSGTPLVVWQDGKVALIDPDSITIPVPEEPSPRLSDR